MLHLSLRDIAFAYSKSAPVLEGVSFEVAKSAHVSLVGPPGGGTSTLLRVIAGDLRPQRGEVRIGPHVVNAMPRGRRPLLFVTSDLEAPGRWSVQHLLVAAVRGRALDREDRKRELDFAVERWQLAPLLGRRVDALSSTERVLANLARIELLRPAVLLADRLLEHANPAIVPWLADELYRLLRVSGTTALSTPSSPFELGLTERLVVLERGSIVQEASPREVYEAPATVAAARATGEINVVPVAIRGVEVDSVIGGWTLEQAPFAGAGVALVRPEAFSVARAGEESDLIFGIEEASFTSGRWLLTGMLSGGVSLRVSLPPEAPVHKGRLIALRYDPRHFKLLPRAGDAPWTTVPMDVVPPMAESR